MDTEADRGAGLSGDRVGVVEASAQRRLLHSQTDTKKEPSL